MVNIRLLDCTLRDGGRVIDCNFGKKKINNILNDLQASHIDIIEVGFIRNKIQYKEGSTFFTGFDQVKEYLRMPTSEIVMFVDYGMVNVALLPKWTPENPVTGIRFGFTKGNFDAAFSEMLEIKQKGYKLYVQDVNTPGYSDAEILSLIDKVNVLAPYSFAIVDTYGAMYQEDVIRYFDLYDRNLLPEICIDFHSHNNYQLSFSLAQEIIRMARVSKRTVIIDSTLYGMGKVAGNLCTELIAEFLNRKYDTNYDLARIFDSIDENIIDYLSDHKWGYSTNALLSGIYMAHPNNVIYLTEKFKLDTNDVGNILSMIDVNKRQTYDYDNIEDLYIKYNSNQKGDTETREILHRAIKGRSVLIVAPGRTLKEKVNELQEFIKRENPVVISVNFDCKLGNEKYIFFANKKRYKEYLVLGNKQNIIISSNVNRKDGTELMVDYGSLVEKGGKNFDNATIMLLRLLKDMDVRDVYLAGFDGFEAEKENFASSQLEFSRGYKDAKKLNLEISVMFSKIREEYSKRGAKIHFLTDSIYDIYKDDLVIK